MSCKFVSIAAATLAFYVIAAAGLSCPSDANCVCGGSLAVELQCNIEGHNVEISILPNIYLIIKCDNAQGIAYDKLPKLSNDRINIFKSVTFKDCPFPESSFKNVLTTIGVSKTLSLIIQNAKYSSGYLDRKHFAGLQDLSKLLLSVNGVTDLPDNLFVDMHNLTWLNIKSNGISLTEKLFEPLERLDTLEISHNHMTNITGSLFSHLSYLRKLSLWQSNITRFSTDLFSGVDVLEELDLSSNGLNELPPSIFNPLKKLKKLTLFSNRFTSLPSNLLKNNEQLETVIIFNNDVKLQKLPKKIFSGLKNLKEVYVQRCEIEIIPHNLFADSAKITNISLAYNDIESMPEAIFNDQINLLELDLSHNKINNLETRLFSSLVKLEKLKLNHNFLQEISGQTFSSLLSLMYLDMEYNKLKTITPYFFSYNKQRMSINLAYNQLEFEKKRFINNSWISSSMSPFTHTFNLKLLNLSNNEFRVTFDDWWLNGHENLDISYNKIIKLWSPNCSFLTESSKLEKNVFQRPLKQIWIDHNPLICNCQTTLFLFHLRQMKTKGAHLSQLNCRSMETSFCNESGMSYLVFVPFVLTIYILTVVAAILYRQRIYHFFKRILKCRQSDEVKTHEVIVAGTNIDEDFLLHEFIPGLTRHKHIKVLPRYTGYLPNNRNIIRIIKNYIFGCPRYIVVVSPNFVTSVYSNVKITQIRQELMESKNTILVFADIGPENSIYEFLKAQRDPNSSVIWNNHDFWHTLLSILDKNGDKKNSDNFETTSTGMFDTINYYKSAF